jgi:Heterokaryon incompatibility protein (HET)
MELYQYDYLQAPNDIRLISLAPGKGEEPLFGHIFRESLEEETTYCALSYAWQGYEKPFRLETPKGSVPITDSLNSALLHLREPSVELIIWVDAVCINQDDNCEKE